MRLHEVAIHNFRGVLDQTFCLQDYSLLVGANNAGKSTVIDAIRAFYEKGTKFEERDVPYITTKDNESWVELEFGLERQEWDSLKREYQRDDLRLRVRRRFRTSAKLQDGKSAEGYAFACNPDGTTHTESFYGAKGVQNGKLGDVIFIPAVSKVDDHTKTTGPSALRDLLTDVLDDIVEDSKSFAGFKTEFERFSAGIMDEETKDGRSLSTLQDDINELIRTWGTEFKLKLTPPSASDIIKGMFGHTFQDDEHGKEQAIDRYGSGFQRHFIYSLIMVAARHARKSAPKKTKEFAPCFTLILFEEPEAFLHPPQQEVLARGLRSLVKDSDRQVLCSTHSSHFVGNNTAAIPSLIRVSRDGGEVSCHQICKERWESLISANQDIGDEYPTLKAKVSADDMKPEMEAVKHFLWLNPDRCGLFFANHVLLVEGTTEVALIKRLIDDEKIRAPERGLYVLDCLGKYNIHRFTNLVTALGIPHSVVYDDDDNRNEHKELNSLICKSCSPNLTLECKPIPDKLEAFLGVPSAGPPYRKPQHLLFHYDSGTIEDDKVKAFCELIESCFPHC